ncbi:MAG: hypothetical protein AABX70_06210 [Nanoarchaeota archaeon]
MRTFVATLVLFLLLLPFIAARDCPDYCRDGLQYYGGVYNERASQCDYQRQSCENGCDANGMNCLPTPLVVEPVTPEITPSVRTTEGTRTQTEIRSEPIDREAALEQRAAEQRAAERRAAQLTEQQATERRMAQRTAEQEAAEQREATRQALVIPSMHVQPPASEPLVEERHEEKPKPRVVKPVVIRSNGQISLITQNGRTVTAENGYIRTTAGGKSVLILQKDIPRSNDHVQKIELDTSGERPVYTVESVRPIKLLGLFPFDMPVVTQIDPATLKIILEKKPWWGSFAFNLTSTLLPCDADWTCDSYEEDLCHKHYYCDHDYEHSETGEYGCIEMAGTDDVECNPTDNGCVENACNPKTGKCEKKILDGEACDDGNPCTKGDVCQSETCLSGKNTCQCQNDKDCDAYEDGDACNGKLYCDSGETHKCLVNPATVVTCPSAFDTKCSINTCDLLTGKCGFVPVLDNSPCNGDWQNCTKGDSCQGGSCVAGKWDYTDINCECANQEDCLAHEDGNVCNGTLFCHLWHNRCWLNPATVKTCQTVDNTACKKNTCNKKDGSCEMINESDGLGCDDGNSCTDQDACSNGKCQGGPNVCECQKDADCTSKNNLCTGLYYCDYKQGFTCQLNPASIKTCQTVDDTQCQHNTCDPKTGLCGMVFESDGTPCEADGSECTDEDTCQKGMCILGAWNFTHCECGKDSDCKDDGNVCNGISYCDKYNHKCLLNPATVKSCPSVDDTGCIVNTCQPDNGVCKMTPVNVGEACALEHPCMDGTCSSEGKCAGDWNYKKVLLNGQKCECKNQGDCTTPIDGCGAYCDKLEGVCKKNPAKC